MQNEQSYCSIWTEAARTILWFHYLSLNPVSDEAAPSTCNPSEEDAEMEAAHKKV